MRQAQTRKSKLVKQPQEGLPECGGKRPAEQLLCELLICRVLQQQQIPSILIIATVKNKDIYKYNFFR